MPLTADQVNQFKTQGYLVVPGFFSQREILALRADLDRLKREGKFRNVTTDDDGKSHSKTKMNLQICPLNPFSTLVRALPFQEKVTTTVSQLIGDPYVLHLDQVFLKPARHGAGTNWHQDNAYFKIEDPMKGTAMWIAIHDATIANGTIRVIPGSQGEKFEHSRDPQSDHHIRCYPPEERAIHCEVPAGGVVFFAYGIPHATGANNTDNDRAGLALHFLNKQFAGDLKSLHPILTGPETTGGEAEYGAKITGTWDQEVEKALAPVMQTA